MRLEYIILHIVFAVIYVLAVGKTMRVFYEDRLTSFATIIFTYSFLFFARLFVQLTEFMDFLIENSYVASLIFVLPVLFIVTFNYKSSLIKRVSVALFSFIIFEAIVTVIGNYIFFPLAHIPFLNAVLTYHWPAVPIFSGTILLHFVAILLQKYFSYIRKSFFDSSVFWGLTIIVSYLWIVTVLGGNEVLSPTAINFMSTAFLGVGTFFLLFLYNLHAKTFEYTIKSALHAQEKEYYYTQCQLMQESVENTKTIRHDMQLHLVTTRDLVANNKLDEATNYLDSLIGDINKNEIHSNTKNIAFDSIINFKLGNARQENIKLDLRLLIPPSLNIEVADIVIIMGNLLDNALDAVSKIGEKVIKLDIEYSRKSLFIQIENTFDGIVLYEEKIDEEEKHIGTRKDSNEHGYGLKSIRKSVEKYNGHFDISHEGNIFSATVLLYADTSFQAH